MQISQFSAKFPKGNLKIMALRRLFIAAYPLAVTNSAHKIEWRWVLCKSVIYVPLLKMVY